MASEVASNAGAVEGAAQEGGDTYRLDKWSMLKTFIFRMMFTYFVFSLFRRSPAPQPAVPGQPAKGGPSTNMFIKDDPLDLYVYLTPNKDMPNFTDTSSLFWFLENVKYGNWNDGISKDGSHTIAKTITASQDLKQNGSLYIHAFLVQPGFSPDPSAKERYSKKYTIHSSKMLTHYRKLRIVRTVNLLTGASEAGNKNSDTLKLSPDAVSLPVTHWHPNITINLIDDATPWIQGSVPAPISDHIQFYPPTNQYYPALYLNDYWNLNEEYMPVNETTSELLLRITFAPMSLFKWQMYLSQSMRKSWYTGIFGETESDKMNDEDDQDIFRKTLLDTSPYLLAITIVVSIIHSIFEMLAFKNDIQFWKSRESFEGLSIRSVFFNIFQSVVVVLYVLDNDTNFVVKVSVCIGLAIEIWKVKKVVSIGFDRENKLFGIVPCPYLIWQQSYVESETKVYDQMAFKYLSWALFPLLAAYAVYSLIYEEHRGWYSWVLSMLYGFLLTFGFIAMTPQLFINYKLKSVAHLPWRMLTYKALNTFIDDLFAFVIKTPTLYRIGCLRDDVIFFIYLYQRWIYRMDPTRVNEFGVSEEMLSRLKEEEEKKKNPSGEAKEEPKSLEAKDRKEADVGEQEKEEEKKKGEHEGKEKKQKEETKMEPGGGDGITNGSVRYRRKPKAAKSSS